MWKGEFLKEFLAEGIHARGLDQSDYAKKINPPHTVDVHDILKTKSFHMMTILLNSCFQNQL